MKLIPARLLFGDDLAACACHNGISNITVSATGNNPCALHQRLELRASCENKAVIVATAVYGNDLVMPILRDSLISVAF